VDAEAVTQDMAKAQEALADGVVSYGELQDLIHAQNSDIAAAWATFADKKTDVVAATWEMESAKRGMTNLKEDATARYDIMGIIQYTTQEAILDAVIKGYKDAQKVFDKPQTASALRYAERTVTMYAQQAMLGYIAIDANERTLNKLVDMYRSKLDVTSQMLGLGMATDYEVQTAKAELLGAQAQLISLAGTKESTKRALWHLLGLDGAADVAISTEMPLDLDRIPAMDLAADTQKAIGNNQTLIEMRHEDSTHATAQVARRQRTIGEAEDLLGVQMEKLYNDVLQKKLAYDAAVTGQENARLKEAAVAAQYRLGFLGRTEYYGSQLTYIQKEAAYDTARMELLQAMEAYGWAVTGLTAAE
jgi:hypothetical protein